MLERYQELQETFKKYRNGQLSEHEARAFLTYIQSGLDEEFVQDLIQKTLETPIDQNQPYDAELKYVLDSTWQNLQSQIRPTVPIKRLMYQRWVIGIAATVVCILGIGIYKSKTVVNPEISSKLELIVPGKQTATLTLASGKQIKLSEAHDGQVAEDAGVRISKSADGQLVYEIQDTKTMASGYNILSTSKGETYRVRLPDGTNVWLNASSSLRYPTDFSTHPSRKVELTGEAYFEVAKDVNHSFIVRSGSQDVKVLGTRFNVNSYSDEPNIQTTLLEGKVSIIHGDNITPLLPSQQANLLRSGRMQVRTVDAELFISWINNEFVFDEANIETIMRQIIRWYDVDVVYQGAKTTEKFTGRLSRFEDVSQLLRMFERTGAVQFKIEGKTIYVSK